jgi:hypothetical protein
MKQFLHLKNQKSPYVKGELKLFSGSPSIAAKQDITGSE